jgi:hypothetical protein
MFVSQEWDDVDAGTFFNLQISVAIESLVKALIIYHLCAQHIVLSLLLCALRRTNPTIAYPHVSHYAPFFEVDQHWDGSQLIESIRANHSNLGRRVFNTHLRWDMLPKGAKYIYLVRSPMDVCLSFHYHLTHQQEGGYNGTFDSFFSEWIAGGIAFGSWTDHVRSFTYAFKEECVLLLSYEDMLTDLPKAVSAISDFIDADVTKEEQDTLLESFSFQAMKANLAQFQPRSVSWKNDFQFLRKGVAGDSQQIASEAQRRILKDHSRILVGELEELLDDQPEEAGKILKLLQS